MKAVNKPIEWSAKDLSMLLEECLGQIDMLEDLILIYKSNIREFFASMDQALKASDMEGIAFATHKIRCGLKMLRLYKLAKSVETINAQSKNGAKLEDIRKGYLDFLNEYSGIERGLEEALELLKKQQV